MRALTQGLGTHRTSRVSSTLRAVISANDESQTASETCSRRTAAHDVHRSCASPTSLNASPAWSESTVTSTYCVEITGHDAASRPLRPIRATNADRWCKRPTDALATVGYHIHSR